MSASRSLALVVRLGLHQLVDDFLRQFVFALVVEFAAPWR
jgi:hypothetical protein